MREYSARIQTGQWLLILVLTIAMIVLYTDSARTKNCLSNYIAKDRAAAEARIEPASEERAALLRVFDLITQQPPNRSAIAKAIEDYRNLLHRNDEIRNKNPFPKVPESC